MSNDIHPTIRTFVDAATSGDLAPLPGLMASDVRFMPPTYWKTWVGRDRACLLLEHVTAIFKDFRYRRIIGGGADWSLEFQCRVGDLDAVGADLVTLNTDGLIEEFEVVMRPHKAIGALREAINRRVMTDARFAMIMSQSS